MANNEEKLMSELTRDEMLDKTLEVTTSRDHEIAEGYYMELEAYEAWQGFVDDALSEGIIVETTPQLSREEALMLEIMFLKFKKSEKMQATGSSVELIDKIIKTYLNVKSKTTDYGGWIINAHRWKGEIDGESFVEYEMVGISPWLYDIHLTSLLSAAGYDYRED